MDYMRLYLNNIVTYYECQCDIDNADKAMDMLNCLKQPLQQPTIKDYFYKQYQQKPEKHSLRQRSSSPPRPSPSDVTNATGTQQQADDRQAQAAKTGQARTVRSPDETRPGSSEGIPDSECITDSKGRSLEPGDAVEFERDGSKRWGIYVGGQEVVWSEWTDGLLVHKEQLQLTKPFRKATVENGGVRVFPPEERVDRAMSLVGTPFTEGDWNGSDFPWWIYTGMGRFQAESRGFWLSYW